MPQLPHRFLEGLLGPNHMSKRELERELRVALRDSLRYLAPIAALIYLASAVSTFIGGGPWRLVLTGSAILIAALLGILGVVAWTRRLPPGYVEVATLGFFVVFSFRAVLLTHALPEMRVGVFAIILIATSALFVTPRWFTAGILVVGGGWGVAWSLHPEVGMPQLQATIVGVAAFGTAVALFIARRTALADSVDARWAAEDRARALEEANLRLAHARGEVARSLEEVEVRNEDLQRFAYVVSHDLREPVRMVRSYLQLILRRAGDKFTEDEREFFGYAIDGAERLNTMILGILEFSRVETHGEDPVPVDADKALEDALSNLRMSLQETDAEVEREPLPQVLADPTQLTQVFQNLVSNAVKYRRPDVPPRVQVGASTGDGMVTFHVADNGRGIPPGEVDSLFQLFKRGSHTMDVEGQGLGLAMVKRIVERHGGEVWVDSEVGEGSTFHFSLPAAPGSPGSPG